MKVRDRATGSATCGRSTATRFGDARRRARGATASTRSGCSERVSGAAPDPVRRRSPFAAGAHAASSSSARACRCCPGRNPALLAKEWATLDVLSGGRALPAFGLGIAAPGRAAGVRRRRARSAAPIFDEALPLIRRLWTEDDVDHDGARFHYEGCTVLPKPVQQPLDVWLGGTAPRRAAPGRPARRRVARRASATPDDCAERPRRSIEEAAAEAGRAIDPEHFGAMVLYAHDEIPERAARRASRRASPDADPDELVARRARRAARAARARTSTVGFSKLVLVPLAEPGRLGRRARHASPTRCSTSRPDCSAGRPDRQTSATHQGVAVGSGARSASWVTSGERARLTVADHHHHDREHRSRRPRAAPVAPRRLAEQRDAEACTRRPGP